jgi:Tfp pilus assembly major pilin PilA
MLTALRATFSHPLAIATAVLVALLLAAIGVQTVRLADAETQVATKAADIATLRTQHANELLAAEQKHRAEEQAKQADSERISHEQDQKLADVTARAVSAQHAAASLRNEVARLNARPVPTDPVAAGYAGEASVARQLLDACSSRYTELAASADQLRVQVIGLIDWAYGPAGAGK